MTYEIWGLYGSCGHNLLAIFRTEQDAITSLYITYGRENVDETKDFDIRVFVCKNGDFQAEHEIHQLSISNGPFDLLKHMRVPDA